MKKSRHLLKIAALGLLLLPDLAGAQTNYFQYNSFGDVLLGFRKTGAFQGTNELVINIGNITNLVGLSPGSQITISGLTQARLTAAFSSGNGDVQWSAFAAFPNSSAWVTPIGSYPRTTLWYTMPSTATNTQSTPPARSSTSGQGATRQLILGVGPGANNISSGLVTTNADNNTFLVREPLNAQTAGFNLTTFIGDSSDSSIGDFQTANVVENTTPHTFTTAQRSDLYQSCPTSFADPITGLTTGNCYFVGYFLFNSNGTITFTRASAVAPPPPPPVLTISRSGNTSTISFGTTNGATYTLIATNAAGITAARSTWPTLGSPIVGNGGATNFTDTTTNANRIYGVKAQ